MIDEEKTLAESEKIRRIGELALEVDVDVLRAAMRESEFLVTLLDGWLGDMLRTAMASSAAFIEYREKLDAVISEMGLDMLMNLGKKEQWDA